MTATKGTQLRSVIGTGGLLIGVGARDAVDARLIEDARFDFVWASLTRKLRTGFEYSFHDSIPRRGSSDERGLSPARGIRRRYGIWQRAQRRLRNETNRGGRTRRLIHQRKVFANRRAYVPKHGTRCCPLRSLPGRSS